MRLIDADKLKDIKRLYHFREQYDDNLFNHIINQLPTIDAVPLEQYQSMERTVNKLQEAKIAYIGASMTTY